MSKSLPETLQEQLDEALTDPGKDKDCELTNAIINMEPTEEISDDPIFKIPCIKDCGPGGQPGT